MPTKEEIREGIRQVLSEGLWDVAERAVNLPKKELCLIPKQREEWIDEILQYLHSQGVVIKVDRALPTNPFSGRQLTTDSKPFDLQELGRYRGYNRCEQDMLKAGYVVVEPLIEG